MNLIAVCLPFTEVPVAFIDRLHAPIQLYLQNYIYCPNHIFVMIKVEEANAFRIDLSTQCKTFYFSDEPFWYILIKMCKTYSLIAIHFDNTIMMSLILSEK